MIRAETFRVAIRELAGNQLRTALTTLGIVFGVAAVIAMVSIAEGARHEAMAQIRAMGASTLRIRAKELRGRELARARGAGVMGLTLEDADAIAKVLGVEAAAPLLVPQAPVSAGDRSADLRVVGTTAAYPGVVSFAVASGRFIADEDVRDSGAVCVLGAAAASELLPFADPIGREIRIGREAFRVVGVMEDRRQATASAGSLAGADVARDVYIPVSAARLRFASDPLSTGVVEIAVRVQEDAGIRLVAALVQARLAGRHRGIEDFEAVVPEELLRQGQKNQRIFNVVMGAIASISLVVGGIGIMNVMLVTVVQRTREIGIRRATGATRKDIRDQFLVEALTIAVLGGLVGIVLGAGLAFAIALYAGWLTIVSPYSVLLAFTVAGATGVGFGLFPAVKASRMDPIDCLRPE